MKNTVLSRITASLILAGTMLSALPVTAFAASLKQNSPQLTSPDVGAYRYTQNMTMYAYGETDLASDRSQKVCWEDCASDYVVYTKLLYGSPDVYSSCEDGILLEEYSFYGDEKLRSNSFRISADDLETYEDSYLKISVQGIDADGDYTYIVNNYFYIASSDDSWNWSDWESAEPDVSSDIILPDRGSISSDNSWDWINWETDESQTNSGTILPDPEGISYNTNVETWWINSGTETGSSSSSANTSPVSYDKTLLNKRLNELKNHINHTILDASDTAFEIHSNYINKSNIAYLVWDTVVNIDDLFTGVDLETSKSIRAVQALVDQMTDPAAEETGDADKFIRFFTKDVFEYAEYDAETEAALNVLKKILTIVDSNWESQQTYGIISTLFYYDLIHAFDQMDSQTLNSLLKLYNRSAGRLVQLSKLRNGLKKTFAFVDELGKDAKKFFKAAQTLNGISTVINDYSTELSKLETIRSCISPSDTVLMDAVSYCESYYQKHLHRLASEIEKFGVSRLEDMSGVWTAVKLTFTYVPIAASASESACLLTPLSELELSASAEILDDINYMMRTSSLGEIGDLRQKIAMLSDLGIYANNLAQKLTFSQKDKNILQKTNERLISARGEAIRILDEIEDTFA